MTARKKPDDTNVVTFEVDGTRYNIDLFDLSGIEWRDAKGVTGLVPQRIVSAALADGDMEAIAALLWLWRRRDEPNLDFEAVLGGLTFRSLMQRPEKAAEADASPPA